PEQLVVQPGEPRLDARAQIDPEPLEQPAREIQACLLLASDADGHLARVIARRRGAGAGRAGTNSGPPCATSASPASPCARSRASRSPGAARPALPGYSAH